MPRDQTGKCANGEESSYDDDSGVLAEKARRDE
jgi:hypothetical protein